AQDPNANTVRAGLLQSALGCSQQAVPDCRQLLAGRLNIRGAMSFVRKGVHSMGERISTPESIQAPAGTLSSQGSSSEPKHRRGVSAAGSTPAGRVTPAEVDETLAKDESGLDDEIEAADHNNKEDDAAEERGQGIPSRNRIVVRQPSKAQHSTP